jgi:predicted RNase H-like HicB family nuclease
MYYIYPAVFEPDGEGGYIVAFQDVPGCVTGGKTLEEAFRMAYDALGGCLCVREDEGMEILPPTPIQRIEAESPEGFASMVAVDITRYRNETEMDTARMIEMLPIEDQRFAHEFVKKLVLAWDPDFTKVTQEGAAHIKAAEESGFVPDGEIDWDKLGL